MPVRATPTGTEATAGSPSARGRMDSRPPSGERAGTVFPLHRPLRGGPGRFVRVCRRGASRSGSDRRRRDRPGFCGGSGGGYFRRERARQLRDRPGRGPGRGGRAGRPLRNRVLQLRYGLGVGHQRRGRSGGASEGEADHRQLCDRECDRHGRRGRSGGGVGRPDTGRLCHWKGVGPGIEAVGIPGVRVRRGRCRRLGG